ncbi:MAG: diguanylate cyclase [Thiomicrorhabdus sp.]|nr:diguanylate cyclase [Thiomicrorhabdus sp.]
MRFPNVYDICSPNVLKISCEASLNEALDQMLEFNHRNIIVVGEHYHHILRAKEVLQFNLQKVSSDTALKELEMPRLSTVNKDDNILDCVAFLKDEIDQIGIVDEQGDLCGILTHSDIVNSIDPEVLLENYSVSDVLKRHRGDIWVKPTDKTEDVIALMVKHNSDCVIAKDGKAIKGIFTTKDVMRLFDKQSHLECPLADYMSQPVETIYSSMSIKAALRFIQEKHFKRVVVVNEEEELQGIVTQNELISLSYSNWAVIMRKFQNELQEINALLEQKSKHYEGLAARDPLTGLFNRYKFTEIFSAELTGMKARENTMSLIMLDLDHFKKINDQFGHNAGDKVLTSVAKVLEENQRQTDVICRWGGEEFLILLPSADLDKAQLIAETIREKVKQMNLIEGWVVTASFGVTQVNAKDTLETLVERADSALYQAKKNGRDQVATL